MPTIQPIHGETYSLDLSRIQAQEISLGLKTELFVPLNETGSIYLGENILNHSAAVNSRSVNAELFHNFGFYDSHDRFSTILLAFFKPVQMSDRGLIVVPDNAIFEGFSPRIFKDIDDEARRCRYMNNYSRLNNLLKSLNSLEEGVLSHG